jgi:excisionase family DNA binding protein
MGISELMYPLAAATPFWCPKLENYNLNEKRTGRSGVLKEYHGDVRTGMVKNTTDTLLSIDELAMRLNCHPSTIRRLAKLGRLPALRIGTLYRFDFEAVMKALAKAGRQA